VTVSKVKGTSHSGGISDETADDQQGDRSHLRALCSSVEAGKLGKFVAVSLDGRMLLGDDREEVAKEAFRRSGSGNFAMMRVGLKAVREIRESVISEQRC
jgi:hypothetical protein